MTFVPLSIRLSHLPALGRRLLYASILENANALRALERLPFYSSSDTLTQLTRLFGVYSALRSLLTRATWCSAGPALFKHNPHQIAAATALEQVVIEARELLLDLFYIEGLDFCLALLPTTLINIHLNPVIASLSEEERIFFFASITSHPGYPHTR